MHDFDVSVVTDDDRIDSIRVTAMSPVHAVQCGIILMGGAAGIYSVWDADGDGMPVLESTIGMGE